MTSGFASRGSRSLGLIAAMTLALAFAFHAGAASPDPKGAAVVYVATGANFPDALGAGPAAALGNGPILLVQAESVPSQTTTELTRLRPRLIVIVGGTAVVSTNVENTLKALSFGPTVIRVSGSNRYATAAAISAEAFPCAGGAVLSGYDRSGPICRPPLSGRWNRTILDTSGTVGIHPSLAIDAFGNPVVAYLDQSAQDLKLVHCNDPSCDGGNESVLTVNSSSASDGMHASLVLDEFGYPVVAYHDFDNSALKLARCNDVNCVLKYISTVDNSASVGEYPSMALDLAGLPVIAYYDASITALKLVHCNDVNCIGGGESIVTVDNASWVGQHASLVLDASGNPVIAYYDASATALKLAHCGDPNCAGVNSVVTVVNAGNDGQSASLALDRSGNPVIAYYDQLYAAIEVVRCNDPNCAGGDESHGAAAGGAGSFEHSVSMVLDAAGHPVISYYDPTTGGLRLVRCNDPTCFGDDELNRVVDTEGTVGYYSSLRLDAAGSPVIAYYDSTNGQLMLVSG